jgi:uncharacterized protein (TIGR00725 family)
LSKSIQIGVIGGRDVTDEILQMAEEVGKGIAEKEAVLICGGLGGVMKAACRGAKSAGGTTVGILPAASMDDANPWVDIIIPTDLGVARNALVIHACNGVIAIGGRYGTLSEMAFALQKGIPLVSLKSWHVDETVIKAKTPKDAVEEVFNRIQLNPVR